MLLETQVANNSTHLVDRNASASLKEVNGKNLTQQYVQGSAEGSIIRDLFVLGGTSVYLELGLANLISDDYGDGIGMLALGFVKDPKNISSSETPTLLDQLVTSKFINSRFYSIWLNSMLSSTGSLLFGGVDTEKFLGPLIEIPVVVNDSAGYYSSMVRLTSLTVFSNGKSPEIKFAPMNVVLDTGTTAIYLPNETAYSIYTIMGVRVKDSIAYMECKNDTGIENFFSFGFENRATIKVP